MSDDTYSRPIPCIAPPGHGAHQFGVADARVSNDTSYMQAAETLKRKEGRGQQSASYVIWGFKAPVSMLLVPFFQEAWGQAKFLHVVRDGRDIAFSGNQTPVEKFFEDTFPKGSRERRLSEPPLMAIRMWSVWNSGLYSWATAKRRGSPARGGDGAHLDYLLLHVEDLIDPRAKVGYFVVHLHAYTALACSSGRCFQQIGFRGWFVRRAEAYPK